MCVQNFVLPQADIVFIGPEEPLAAGLVDALEAAGIKAVGPTKQFAQVQHPSALISASWGRRRFLHFF